MFFGLNDVGFLAAVSAPALDPDAAAYIAAVEAADTQALEPAVRAAINDFVVGCKADGIWAAIKASCILAGARTLAGALVPLVGTAPTNVDGLFVSDDYDRKTGLVGDGSTKYLDSNRNNNADPQDSNHNAVWISQLGGTGQAFMGAGTTGIGANILAISTLGAVQTRCRFSGASTGSALTTGFYGLSRPESGSYVVRNNNANATVNETSQAPFNANLFVFARTGPTLLNNSRLAFYSIGESLNLALLDARVTALINAFDAAI
jgi:hypothetical protein